VAHVDQARSTPMSAQLYNFTTEIEQFQKNCRLTLEIDGDKIPVSFDDAIEFKIEIARVLVSASPSAREVHGTFDQWRIKFFPNNGGFSIKIRHPIHPIRTLALNAKQAEGFCEEMQRFIDAAGQRS
jgi:hypothetical protein